jgi:hypothetical protein
MSTLSITNVDLVSGKAKSATSDIIRTCVFRNCPEQLPSTDCILARRRQVGVGVAEGRGYGGAPLKRVEKQNIV